jgi:hypothetical protein
MVIEKFKLAKAQFSKLMWCFGIDVFNEDYEVGLLTVVTSTIAVLGNVLPVYSIVIKYPDFMTMLKTTALWGVVLEVLYLFLDISISFNLYFPSRSSRGSSNLSGILKDFEI